MVAILGRRVRASMAIPVIVLMIDRPSAPPSAHAAASATMSDGVGRQLDPQRLLHRRAAGPHQIAQDPRIGAELDARRL